MSTTSVVNGSDRGFVLSRSQPLRGLDAYRYRGRHRAAWSTANVWEIIQDAQISRISAIQRAFDRCVDATREFNRLVFWPTDKAVPARVQVG